MRRCHLFDFKDAEKAGSKLDYEVLKELQVVDTEDTDYSVLRRTVVRCKRCHGLMLMNKVAITNGDEEKPETCFEYYPVDSVEEAEKMNGDFPGDKLEMGFPGKYLAKGYGVYTFGNSIEPPKYHNGKRRCLCCGGFILSFEWEDVCEVCGWEEDAVMQALPNFWGGANAVSLNEAKSLFRKHGDK